MTTVRTGIAGHFGPGLVGPHEKNGGARRGIEWMREHYAGKGRRRGFEPNAVSALGGAL